MPKVFRLGSRRSPLAMFQTKQIAEKLLCYDSSIEIEYVFLESEGDRLKDQPLRSLGGKNIFIKDIEQALLDGVIDMAVHSFKDISAELDEKTVLAGFLPSEYTQDCILGFVPFDEMESIATSSLRRSWFLKQQFPKMKVLDIRGNVGTRLEACREGNLGVMVSQAGVYKLGLQAYIQQVFADDLCLPAPGQGVVAVQCLKESKAEEALKNSLNATDFKLYTMLYFMMKALQFSCDIPLGASLKRVNLGYSLNISCVNQYVNKEKCWQLTFNEEGAQSTLLDVAKGCQTWVSKKTI